MPQGGWGTVLLHPHRCQARFADPDYPVYPFVFLIDIHFIRL